jgi:hypothetical protein
VAAIAAPAVADAAPITYVGTQQVDSILANYSVTTDGTTGVAVDSSHVTAFDVVLKDAISSVSYGRTSLGGTGSASGGFNASATALSLGLFGQFSLYSNAQGPFGGFLGNLTFNGPFLSPGSTSAQIDDAAHGNPGLSQSAGQPNNVAFATVLAATPAVPEPATWGTMMLGLGALGAVLRRTRTRVRFA